MQPTGRRGAELNRLAGGAERAEIFKQFSADNRIYRHRKVNRIAIVWENAGVPKLEAVLAGQAHRP